MSKWIPFVEQKTRSAPPIRRGDVTITTEARALVVHLPFMGFVWNRPAAVIVERNGRRERRPINDPTRTVMLLMTAVSGGVWLGLRLARRLSRSSDREVESAQ